MKAFTALQHVLSALFIFVMATFWALPMVPALYVFHQVNAFGAEATEWMGYLFTSIAAALAFIAWGLGLLLLGHPGPRRAGHHGKPQRERHHHRALLTSTHAR